MSIDQMKDEGDDQNIKVDKKEENRVIAYI